MQRWEVFNFRHGCIIYFAKKIFPFLAITNPRLHPVSSSKYNTLRALRKITLDIFYCHLVDFYFWSFKSSFTPAIRLKVFRNVFNGRTFSHYLVNGRRCNIKFIFTCEILYEVLAWVWCFVALLCYGMLCCV